MPPNNKENTKRDGEEGAWEKMFFLEYENPPDWAVSQAIGVGLLNRNYWKIRDKSCQRIELVLFGNSTDENDAGTKKIGLVLAGEFRTVTLQKKSCGERFMDKFTEDQFRRISEKLNKLGISAQCNLCAGTMRLDPRVRPIMYGSPKGMGQNYEAFLATICGQCGQTRLFNMDILLPNG